MKCVPEKSLLIPAAQYIGISGENYVNILLDLISNDDNLVRKIKGIIFKNQF